MVNKDVVFVVVMQEGMVNFCLIIELRILVKQRIEYIIFKKRLLCKEVEGGMLDFYGKILLVIFSVIDFNECFGIFK